MTWSVRSLVAGAAAEAMSLGQEWLDETSPVEGALFVAGEHEHAFAKHNGAESDQGGSGGRLVGADEEC